MKHTDKTKTISTPLLRAFREWSEDATRRFQGHYELETQFFLKELMVDLDLGLPMTIAISSIDAGGSGIRRVPLARMVRRLIKYAKDDADIGDEERILNDAADEFERNAKTLRNAAKKLTK